MAITSDPADCGCDIEQRPHVLGAGGDRQHRAILAASRFGHQNTTGARCFDESLHRDDARRREGGDLTEAVTGRRIGGHTEHVEQRKLRKACGRDGRLGIRHRGELGLLCIQRGRVEYRLREHHTGKIGEITIEPIPDREGLGKVECEIGAHPDVLAPLAGEEERRLAFACLSETDRDVGVLELGPSAFGERLTQPLSHVSRAIWYPLRPDLRARPATHRTRPQIRTRFAQGSLRHARRRRSPRPASARSASLLRAQHHEFGGQ